MDGGSEREHPSVRCKHGNFYHHSDELYTWSQLRKSRTQTHMCVFCPLRISYHPDEDRWDVSDMLRSCGLPPEFVVTEYEYERALKALAGVLKGKDALREAKGIPPDTSFAIPDL